MVRSYTKQERIDISNNYYDNNYKYIEETYSIKIKNVSSLITTWSKKYDYIKEIKDLRGKRYQYTKEERIDITNHYYDREYEYIENKYGIDIVLTASHVSDWSKKYDYIKEIKDIKTQRPDYRMYTKQERIDIANHYYTKDYDYNRNTYGIGKTTQGSLIGNWSKKYDYIKEIKDLKGKDMLLKYHDKEMIDIANHYYDGDFDYILKVYGISKTTACGRVSEWCKEYEHIREIRYSKGVRYTKEEMIDLVNHYYDKDYDYIKNTYDVDRYSQGSLIGSWAKKYDYIKEIKDLRGSQTVPNTYTKEQMIEFANHYYDGDHDYIMNTYNLSKNTLSPLISKWAKRYDYIREIKELRGKKVRDKYSRDDMIDFANHYIVGDYDYITKNYNIKSLAAIKSNIYRWSKQYDYIASILKNKKTEKVKKKKQPTPVKYTNVNSYPLKMVEEETEEVRNWY